MTRPTASHSAHSNCSHAAYGEVQVDAWTDLHVAGAPDAPFSVVRVQVERLPQ